MVMHRRMLAPINTIKHYTNRSNTAAASGTTVGTTLVQSVVAPATANAFSVREGAVIKAVFVEFWLKSSATAGEDVQFNFAVMKLPSDATVPDTADMTNLGAYSNKKNILFTSQGVLGDLTTQAIPVIREWIKIPKGKQRFGLGDRFNAFVLFTGTAGQVCGQAIYKEYI